MSRQYPCIVVHSIDLNLYAASFMLTSERSAPFEWSSSHDLVFQSACEFASPLLLVVYDEVES